MGILSKDSSFVYNLEIAYGTSCGFLILVVLVLVIIILLQRSQIVRLTAFFNGHQPDEDRRPIYNGIQNNQDDQDLTVVNNDQVIIHQNANIIEVVELMFPRGLCRQRHLRNISALRAFHKSQREALKAYASNQERLFYAAQNQI